MMRRGFTLLELLIASLLFALVGAGAFTTFSLIREAERRTEDRQVQRRGVRITLRLLTSELRSAIRTEGVYDSGFTVETEEDGDRTQSILRFVSTSHDPLRARDGESDLVSLQYMLQIDDGGDTAPGLYRSADTVMDRIEALESDLPTEEEPSPGWELLLPGVVGFSVECYDGTEWQEVWDPETAETLPVGVKVSLELAPENDEEAEEIERGRAQPQIWTAVVYLRQGEPELEDLALAPEAPEAEESAEGEEGETPELPAGAGR